MKINNDFLNFCRREEENPELFLDIAICGVCSWRGPVRKCGTAIDGDFESGYFNVDTCPKCEDGGYIESYDISKKTRKNTKECNKR